VFAAILDGGGAAEIWVHTVGRGEDGEITGYCTFIPASAPARAAGAEETAACGGSNIKAPMRLDFIHSLMAKPPDEWPGIVICRGEGGLGAAAQPMCFEKESAASDPMNCIGVVTKSGSGLAALLKTGPVHAKIISLCDRDGGPCRADSPSAWGFAVSYGTADGNAEALDEAVRSACRAGRGSYEQLWDKTEYMLGQAVPGNIIIRTLDSVLGFTSYPELVPDPPVKFVQGDAFGELTRALAYRLCGMNLRLVGNKGCGKNTLAQTVDWILGVPQYRMQGNAELDKLDLLGGPTIREGTMSYQLSDMLCYLRSGADVVLDEGNAIKPECADVLHSLTDEARQIEVPGYGLVKMARDSSFTITMNEDYAGTNYMNEATIDRFTPIQMSQPESIVDILRRVVPYAPENSLRICDIVYCGIKDKIRSSDGLEPEALTIRGLIDALRAEPLLGLKPGLLDNVAGKPQDSFTRLQLTELIESMIR
jgi:MoxR-like ATPase